MGLFAHDLRVNEKKGEERLGLEERLVGGGYSLLLETAFNEILRIP